MKPGKRRNRLPPFVALSRETLRSKEWREELSSSAKVLYIHLKYKFTGDNNGDLCLHYSELKGLMSKATAWRAFKELQDQEWITKSRQGGIYRFVNKFELTGKYDTAIIKYKL